MGKSFVRVPNDWFQEKDNNRTFASKLGVNGFTMWFAISKHSSENGMAKVVPLQISETVHEMKRLKGFSKSNYIRTILLNLKRLELIECDYLTDKTKPKDLLRIKLKELDYTNGFSAISTELYNDKIEKIQAHGLIILCLLFKNHNIDFGCKMSGFGHAEMTRESISRFTGIKSVKTITHTIESLKKAKGLVKVEQHKILSQDNEMKYLPNCYHVYPKFDVENKYYIDFKSSQP